MADTLKNLVSVTAATLNTVVYTVPANAKVIVKEIVLCNITGGAVAPTVMFGNRNIISGKLIVAYDTLIVSLSSVLEPNTTLSIGCNTSGAMNVYISGIEVV